jgi:hypothetical protein
VVALHSHPTYRRLGLCVSLGQAALTKTLFGLSTSSNKVEYNEIALSDRQSIPSIANLSAFHADCFRASVTIHREGRIVDTRDRIPQSRGLRMVRGGETTKWLLRAEWRAPL